MSDTSSRWSGMEVSTSLVCVARSATCKVYSAALPPRQNRVTTERHLDIDFSYVPSSDAEGDFHRGIAAARKCLAREHNTSVNIHSFER